MRTRPRSMGIEPGERSSICLMKGVNSWRFSPSR